MAGDDDLHEELRPRDDNPEGISLFEIKARDWAAQERIVKAAHELTKRYDLDPSLAEDIEAAVREDDFDTLREAYARFVEALAEAESTE